MSRVEAELRRGPTKKWCPPWRPTQTKDISRYDGRSQQKVSLANKFEWKIKDSLQLPSKGTEQATIKLEIDHYPEKIVSEQRWENIWVTSPIKDLQTFGRMPWKSQKGKRWMLDSTSG